VLTPIHELLWELPAGVWVLGDNAYNNKAAEASIAADTAVIEWGRMDQAGFIFTSLLPSIHGLFIVGSSGARYNKMELRR
jgi:hypothetical protein